MQSLGVPSSNLKKSSLICTNLYGLVKVSDCPQADFSVVGATTVIFASGERASTKAFSPGLSKPSSFVIRILLINCFL